MKKVFTLLAGMAVSLAGFAAVPNLDGPTVMQLKPNPEALAKARLTAVEAFNNPQHEEGDYTRTWTDPSGNVWDLTIRCYSQATMGSFFGFIGADGKSPATVQDLPYIPTLYMIRKLNATQDAVVDGAMFYMCWPTNYIYKQIFTYDGEVDSEGKIPMDKRDFKPAPPSELMNDADFCRRFQEAPLDAEGGAYVGCVPNKEETAWDYYYMLNNQTFQVTGLYNGQAANTIVEDGTVPTVDFRSYDINDNSVEVRNRIYLATERIKRAQISNTFSGIGDVEGFEPRFITTPEFGSVHVFNAGVLNSDMLGLDTPFTEDFDDVTALYVATADQAFEWIVAPGATKFDTEKIRINPLQEQITADMVNILVGYVFADAKYAEDMTLDPKEMKFKLMEGEQKFAEDTQQYYTSIYPAPGRFLTKGYNANWSQIYGMECDNQNKVLTLVNDDANEIAWGTTEGFSACFLSDLSRHVTTTSKQDIIYHYDPNDMNKTRTFSSFGSLDPSEVEAIVAENNVQVIARDGMIVVNAAEKAPVAIFTLDGKLVKAVEAENVAVEAAKGVYVVRVGDKAQKVVL